MDDLTAHPTVKPLALVLDAMRDCSKRGDIVLDAFAGSGTTILAAEQIGRRAYCIEIDPAYADVCIRRWQNVTKHDARLASTNQTFDQLAACRDPSPRGADRPPVPAVPAQNRKRSGDGAREAHLTARSASSPRPVKRHAKTTSKTQPSRRAR
jgi:hypothetical protein